MKSLKAILFIGILGIMLSGCGAGDIPNNTDNNAAPDLQLKDQSEYNDDLDNLVKYMEDNNFISGEAVEMSAQMIGAKRGLKYQFKKGKSNITAEFYDFGFGGTENANELAANTIKEVKEKEIITVLGKEIPAVLSNNERYIMIYTGLLPEDGNENTVKEAFKGFKE